jgi:endonuclease IV
MKQMRSFANAQQEHDLEVYVHAPFLINLGSPTEGTYKNSLASTEYSLKRGKKLAHSASLSIQVLQSMKILLKVRGSKFTKA